MGSTSRLDLLGDPAPVSAATRTIVIAPDTRYVNVIGGETVKFVVGDKSFAWTFDGAYPSFDLNQTVAAGTLDHKVTAYVAPNPLYINDREHMGGHGGGHM
jgi:hypothetical protein